MLKMKMVNGKAKCIYSLSCASFHLNLLHSKYMKVSFNYGTIAMKSDQCVNGKCIK